MLQKAGFSEVAGKGSHAKWKHPAIADYIVIARKDGDDAPKYLEKQVQQILKTLRENGNG